MNDISMENFGKLSNIEIYPMYAISTIAVG